MKSLKLNSGHEIPILGLGTWQLKGETCKQAIKTAIELGYTHIDTAWIYDNQSEIGEALKEMNIEREKYFITSKVWMEDLSYENVIAECAETLHDLQLEYLDMYLIHWPNNKFPVKDTLRAFKDLVDQGKVKSIGVSNFTIKHLKEALEVSDVPISTNQVEFHSHLYQKELLDFCKEKGIVLTAYSPIARGEILNDPVLTEVANKHNKSTAQVALKWLEQKDIVIIPKASSKEHLEDNMDLFDWELTEEEIDQIDNIKTQSRLIDPAFAEFDE